MNFGEYLKEERKKIGISGRELGSRISKSSNYISCIEKSKFIPDHETIKKIFDILNITIEIKDLEKLFEIETMKVKVSAMVDNHHHNILKLDLPDSIVTKLRELADKDLSTPEQQALKILEDYFNTL